MEVINRVIPSEEQMEGFMEPGREGPIYMLSTRMVERLISVAPKPMPYTVKRW